MPNQTLGANLANWRWRWNSANSVLFLPTNEAASTVIRLHEGKTPEDGLGNGQETWKALEENTTRPATRLVRSSTRNWDGQFANMGACGVSSVRVAVFVASGITTSDCRTLRQRCVTCTQPFSLVLQARHRFQGAGSPCKPRTTSVTSLDPARRSVLSTTPTSRRIGRKGILNGALFKNDLSFRRLVQSKSKIVSY